jgi:hypothetical protein
MNCLKMLTKKWTLVNANLQLKLGDYDKTTSLIQKACSLIPSTEDPDQVKVYYLAFKMQCQLKDEDEAM